MCAVQKLPTIRLKAGESRRITRGHPWIYANEIEMAGDARTMQPGELTNVVDRNGAFVAIAMFNRNSLIAGRVLTQDAAAEVDASFIAARLRAALKLRQRFFDAPYYRLIHSESDGLPGLVIDRFGDALVLQFNTAGMDRLGEAVVAAVESVLAPVTIVLRNDSAVRDLEGLEPTVAVMRGGSEAIGITEGGVCFDINTTGGQKTGWYFDQRPARDLVAPLCADQRVLDAYCYVGSFALRAVRAGATHATAIDNSINAIERAEANALANGLDQRCSFVRGNVFKELEARVRAGESYDMVICDPPAFIKSRKTRAAGLRGYRKLARLAAQLVEPGGLLFIASCSHLADPASFGVEVRAGLGGAERSGRIVAAGGAGTDHPVHPQLPESAYLKWQLLSLD